MKELRFLGWWLSFLFACGLVVFVNWHEQLRDFASAHRHVEFYLLLALLLVIPARIIALVAAYLLEFLLVGWSRSSLKMLWAPQASVRLDILSILIMVLLPHRRLGFLLSLGLLYAIEAYASLHIDISLTPLLSTWMLQMVLFVVLQSFLKYWMHRLEHAIPALWALHKFHHSADRMSILTSARQTQLTQGVESGLVLLPMGLLTLPTSPIPGVESPAFLAVVILLGYQTIVQVNGYLVHSNLQTNYGWFGRWLLVSPAMHRLHHAKTPTYHDKNFGFTLVVWDRLFGTYAACDPTTDLTTVPLGLDDNPFNKGLSARGVVQEYFVTTYVVFWREIKKGLAAWLPARQNPRVKAMYKGVG
jgi:sterol desaturase/sphingolipid hydroxylase (fatty acid hydroxylase superfamily)